MNEILKISRLEKSFGSVSVIKRLDLCVPSGCVYGFLGKNGAGKTTVMKMILGLLKPDGGEIFVNGQRVTPGQTKTNEFIGYLPDVPEFYSYMTPSEYLNFCGEISGMERSKIKTRTKELLERVGLEKCEKRIGGFSRGMKQRLGLAQALMGSPKLLICDEPTSALDPVGRKEILDLIESVKKDRAVIFSTHILSDAEKICDRAAILSNGTIKFDGTLSQLKEERKTNKIDIDFFSVQDAQRFIKLYKNCEKTADTRVCANSSDSLDIMKLLYENSLAVRSLESKEPTLEDLFMEAVEDETV